MTNADHAETTWAPRRYFVTTREWLGGFPLSILQLMMRVGVGSVFFKAGLLKYGSWEFTIKLFQDEYKVPVLPPRSPRVSRRSRN